MRERKKKHMAKGIIMGGGGGGEDTQVFSIQVHETLLGIYYSDTSDFSF